MDIHLPQSVFLAVLIAFAGEAKQVEVAHMTEPPTLET